MLAKLWKKVLMLILIIACLFNVVTKLVKNLSLEEELLSSAQYIQDRQDAEKAKEETEQESENQNNVENSNSTNNTTNATNSTTNETSTNNTKKQQNVVVVK